MFRITRALLACCAIFLAETAVAQDSGLLSLRQQVEETERAFAASMADRDFEAFNSYLSQEAVFFSGETALRGKQLVADAWKPYFDGPDAPFSWEPRQVEVLESGNLALSSGPVWNPDGVMVATFNSIWRLEPDGRWRIIFDKGSPVCPRPGSADPD